MRRPKTRSLTTRSSGYSNPPTSLSPPSPPSSPSAPPSSPSSPTPLHSPRPCAQVPPGLTVGELVKYKTQRDFSLFFKDGDERTAFASAVKDLKVRAALIVCVCSVCSVCGVCGVYDAVPSSQFPVARTHDVLCTVFSVVVGLSRSVSLSHSLSHFCFWPSLWLCVWLSLCLCLCLPSLSLSLSLTLPPSVCLAKGHPQNDDGPCSQRIGGCDGTTDESSAEGCDETRYGASRRREETRRDEKRREETGRDER